MNSVKQSRPSRGRGTKHQPEGAGSNHQRPASSQEIWPLCPATHTHHLFPSRFTSRYSVSRSTGLNPASRIAFCSVPTVTS